MISSTGSWKLSEWKIRLLATLLGSDARISQPGRATRTISSIAAPGLGVWMRSVVPDVPEFDDGENRLVWRFRGGRALGTIDDEIFVAFG